MSVRAAVRVCLYIIIMCVVVYEVRLAKQAVRDFLLHLDWLERYLNALLDELDRIGHVGTFLRGAMTHAFKLFCCSLAVSFWVSCALISVWILVYTIH